MGQRLNIEIVNGETSLANCYYHWSAYTHSALCLTKQVIDDEMMEYIKKYFRLDE